jgi:hypothetical protein
MNCLLKKFRPRSFTRREFTGLRSRLLSLVTRPPQLVGDPRQMLRCTQRVESVLNDVNSLN